MASAPQLTRCDREMRRERVLRAYREGASSRVVARRFGLSSGYVRAVVREAGIARRVGAIGAQA